jgi:hypothetical protein
MSDEPSFYISENEAKKESPFEPESKAIYNGPERRKEDRRNSNDRREQVRFELDKEDRRKNEGRRETDATPKYY